MADIYTHIKNNLYLVGDRKIAIWGMGTVGKVLYRELRTIYDNDKILLIDKNSNSYSPSPMNPSCLENDKEYIFIIIAMVSYDKQIELYLNKCGYREIADYIYLGKFTEVFKQFNDSNEKKLFHDIEWLKLAIGRIENRQVVATNDADKEYKVFSQWGEDGIIQHIIQNISISRKIFVEFGVEDYTESNTRFLLMKDNWSGYGQ